MSHIHKLIDWTAGAYIVHKDKVLLRKHDKYDIWCHVGGHVELDEDPVAATIRECKEEVGLDVVIYDSGEHPSALPETVRYLPPPAHMNIHHVGGTVIELHQHIDLIYYATSESNQVTPENADDKWQWLTKEEVENNDEIEPQIKLYALGALKALGTN